MGYQRESYEKVIDKAIALKQRQYSLKDSNEAPIIGFPAGNASNLSTFKNAAKKVLATQDPGEYIIYARSAPSQKVWNRFELYVPNNYVDTEVVTDPGDNSELYERIQELTREKIRLEYENKNLQAHIEVLEEQNSELAKEVKESGQGLGDQDGFKLPPWLEPIAERLSYKLLEKFEIDGDGTNDYDLETLTVPENIKTAIKEMGVSPNQAVQTIQDKVLNDQIDDTAIDYLCQVFVDNPDQYPHEIRDYLGNNAMADWLKATFL